MLRIVYAYLLGEFECAMMSSVDGLPSLTTAWGCLHCRYGTSISAGQLQVCGSAVVVVRTCAAWRPRTGREEQEALRTVTALINRILA